MKLAGKILVASVAALGMIGSGFAAWNYSSAGATKVTRDVEPTVNGEVTLTVQGVTVEDKVENQKLNLVPGQEQLTLSYYVSHQDASLYVAKNFTLKVKAEIQGAPEGWDATKFYLPSVTVEGATWLADQNNPYIVNLDFAWLVGQEHVTDLLQYAKDNVVGVENQKAFLDGYYDVVEHATFVITFEIEEASEETADPVDPTPATPEVTNYVISEESENVTYSNILVGGEAAEAFPANIEEGASLSFAVSPADGYHFEEGDVEITVGGTALELELSEGIYNVSIQSVSGDIGILATATVNQVTPDPTPTPSQTAVKKFQKVTETSQITDGDYLIVYEEDGLAFNGSLETLDAVSNTVAVTISDSEIAYSESLAESVFTYDSSAQTLRSHSGKYIGKTNNDNGLESNTTVLTNTVTIANDSASIVGSGNAVLRYNAASNQTRFRYFKSGTYAQQKAIQLYKLVEVNE